MTPERSARLASALTLTRPGRAHAAVLDGARGAGVRPGAGRAFDAVFFAVFGSRVTFDLRRAATTPRSELSRGRRSPGERRARRAARPAARRRRRGDGEAVGDAVSVVPVAASDEERLREQALRRARARRARAALPADDRRSSSRRRCAGRAAPSATAAASTSTCGARCAARCAPAATRSGSRTGGAASCARRLVLLCDISGSMEPYARAYLQFLTCAGTRRRGVRVRHAADAHHPRAGHALAPSARSSAPPRPRPTGRSGTRIGDALKRLQRPPRPARDGARRGDRDPLRRLGARRSRARRPRDGAAGAARVPDRVGQPARGRGRVRRRGSAGWSRRCRTSTRSSPATR